MRSLLVRSIEIRQEMAVSSPRIVRYLQGICRTAQYMSLNSWCRCQQMLRVDSALVCILAGQHFKFER